jgi:hypothetical protein
LLCLIAVCSCAQPPQDAPAASSNGHALNIWKSHDAPIVRRYHAASVILRRSSGRFGENLQQLEVRHILGKPTREITKNYDSLSLHIDEYIFDDGTIKIVYEPVRGRGKPVPEYRFVTYELRDEH